MNESEKYQGWSNHETWAVALHLNNNQWMYKQYQGAIKRIKARPNKSTVLTDEQFRVGEFSDELKEAVEIWFERFFSNETLVTSKAQLKDIKLMVQDVGSMWRVNWREIAKRFLDEDKINPQIK